MFTRGFNRGRKKVSDADIKAMATLVDLPTARYNQAQLSTSHSENKALYPDPNIAMNASGSDKYAAAHGLPGIKPPREPLMGLRGGARPLSKPARVTTDLSPYGAPKGTSGVTGHSLAHPFKHSIRQFGSSSKLRSGLR